MEDKDISVDELMAEINALLEEPEEPAVETQPQAEGKPSKLRTVGRGLAKIGIVLRDKKAIICINADEPRQQLVLDTMWETIYPQL